VRRFHELNQQVMSQDPEGPRMSAGRDPREIVTIASRS
jgi:hypothetical protein